jgi:hypothetical protein
MDDLGKHNKATFHVATVSHWTTRMKVKGTFQSHVEIHGTYK